MKDKVLATIKEYNLINAKDTIVVGFSGGADSSALLYFLNSIKQEYKLELHACHINHNLRGAEALRDQRYCEGFCKELNIPIYVYSVNINDMCEKTGKSTELCAREERYRIFDELSKKYKAKIATAHSLSDKCETIIWNMCRGTALKGLIGIPAKRNYIIRPLINCTRNEIELFCKNNNINYVTDSTNLTDDYTRNIIRNNVSPILYKLNKNYQNNISNMSKSLELDNDFFKQITLNVLNKIQSQNKYNIALLLSQHKAIIYRVLSKILEKYKIEIRSSTLNNIYKSICKKKILQLNEKLYLLYENNYFSISERQLKPNVTPFFDFNVNINEKFSINGKQVEFKLLNYEQFNNIIKNNKKALKNCLNYDKITLAMHIRQKIDGDKISLFNSNGTKPLKKLFNEAKVPIEQRHKLFVLCDKNKIIWLENFGCSKDVCVDNNTKNILLIKITEE